MLGVLFALKAVPTKASIVGLHARYAASLDDPEDASVTENWMRTTERALQEREEHIRGTARAMLSMRNGALNNAVVSPRQAVDEINSPDGLTRLRIRLKCSTLKAVTTSKGALLRPASRSALSIASRSASVDARQGEAGIVDASTSLAGDGDHLGGGVNAETLSHMSSQRGGEGSWPAPEIKDGVALAHKLRGIF